ncbi:hypothetical protein HPULCUR_004409 [Helicostylum pulchrum]|uniref:Uncharacterized protein n=1 Tax=Helicostylum pulchrum TaxID=562976 RepID=A0ABP9XX87_9FUNG
MNSPSTSSPNKQEKADGGIMIKETSTPFLIIEAKKPDVGEKLALNLKTAWKEKNYEIPLFGVHVAVPAFLFGSILEAVWIHYWRFVFDEIPFIPNQVVCTAIKIYHQYTDQTNLDSPTLIP